MAIATASFTLKLAGGNGSWEPSGDGYIASKEIKVFQDGTIRFTNSAGRTVLLTECPYEFYSLLKQLVVSDVVSGAVPTTKKWVDAG